MKKLLPLLLVASIFSASTASLGFSIKKKKDTIVDNKNSKVGIK